MNEEEEYRVKFTSKKNVVEQIKKYKELLKKVLNGQPQLSEEAKQLLQEELLAVSRSIVYVCLVFFVVRCITTNLRRQIKIQLAM